MRRQQLAHAAPMVPAGYSLIGMVDVTAEAGQELLDTLAEAPDKLGVALAALAEGLGGSGRADLARRRPMGGRYPPEVLRTGRGSSITAMHSPASTRKPSCTLSAW